ncbi:radical SAM protein [Spirochaeta isovalerica]|uniref:MoaA/NifB/PqqE/SkfB family radical SAM enzyme n=1 Tax=Spirochaeta isovalerica TaxID=150 RepID=A0A841RJF2_9SPIO|nr:radical SAM protein [Spirochaeta isovalerica]MBB6482422.1 MoaA/NifB/PqqE/SkfB family radical SAM enzyme [Spirochaeta isovalerica]
MEQHSLSLELTTHCQQNCLHCFARTDSTGFTHMPYSLALEAMDEGLAMGFERLHLTGGEIFLYPRLFDVIDEAQKRGYGSVFINTNGHLIDSEAAERLAERSNVEISLSLNGGEKHHDAIRGAGAYRAARRGLEKALEKEIPVHVFTVADRNNLEQIPRFADDLFKKHPKICDITFIQLRSGPEGEERKLSPEDYVSLVRMTALMVMGGYAVNILENPLSTALALKMGFSHLPPSLPISREGRILIFADGTIGDNHSSDRRFGPYEPGNLAGIYNSSRFAAVRTEGQEICACCPHIEDCRKGGLMKPSDQAHNTEPYDIPFCRKTMDLL